jgi:hypothetical protein
VKAMDPPRVIVIPRSADRQFATTPVVFFRVVLRRTSTRSLVKRVAVITPRGLLYICTFDARATRSVFLGTVVRLKLDHPSVALECADGTSMLLNMSIVDDASHPGSTLTDFTRVVRFFSPQVIVDEAAQLHDYRVRGHGAKEEPVGLDDDIQKVLRGSGKGGDEKITSALRNMNDQLRAEAAAAAQGTPASAQHLTEGIGNLSFALPAHVTAALANTTPAIPPQRSTDRRGSPPPSSGLKLVAPLSAEHLAQRAIAGEDRAPTLGNPAVVSTPLTRPSPPPPPPPPAHFIPGLDVRELIKTRKLTKALPGIRAPQDFLAMMAFVVVADVAAQTDPHALSLAQEAKSVAPPPGDKLKRLVLTIAPTQVANVWDDDQSVANFTIKDAVTRLHVRTVRSATLSLRFPGHKAPVDWPFEIQGADPHATMTTLVRAVAAYAPAQAAIVIDEPPPPPPPATAVRSAATAQPRLRSVAPAAAVSDASASRAGELSRAMRRVQELQNRLQDDYGRRHTDTVLSNLQAEAAEAALAQQQYVALSQLIGTICDQQRARLHAERLAALRSGAVLLTPPGQRTVW